MSIPYEQPQMFKPTGWECPRCHVVHAPWVAQCSCPTGMITYGPIYCGRCGRQGASLVTDAGTIVCFECFEAVKNSTGHFQYVPPNTSGGLTGSTTLDGTT